MQVLETIQEYVPFKHSFYSFSSWIGSKYSGTAKVHDDHQEHTATQGDGTDPQSKTDDANVGDESEQSNTDKDSSADAINQDIDKPLEEEETSFIEPAPISQESLAHDCHSCEGAVSKSETLSGNILNGRVPANCSNSRASLERTPKTDPFLLKSIHVEEGSCYSDSENDRPDLKRRSHDAGRWGTGSSMMPLPMFLKRRKKKKRRGNTWNNRKAAAKMRCDCAVSGEDFCLMHMKSQSESDINGSVYRIGDEYLADLSDISVTSFSLAEDDTSSGSYVDIDLRNIRKYLRDSGSWSQSDRSYELSSDWSEVHRTNSEPSNLDECCSLAEECRESDIPDTASDFSQDSRTTVTKGRIFRRHKRLTKLTMTGHNVNETYLENECFCCHCIVM